MTYDRERRSSDGAGGGAGARTVLPGKVTQIERMYGAPVQRKPASAGALVEDRTHELAAEGTRGTSGPIPHADTIKASFGAAGPVVDSIQAHVGGPAIAASQGMGAEAYATGKHVAFASAPSLHTAAHEAAHVVQQRDGVQLEGGVGTAGDVYERHADAVADRVVAGESAEDLFRLSAAATGNVGDASAMVQRKEASDPTNDDGIETAAQARRGYDAEFRGDWQKARANADTPDRRDPLGTGQGKKAELPGTDPGEQKHEGQTGFGGRLLGASADQAQANAADWGQIATPVQPVDAVLDAAYQAQAKSVSENSSNGGPRWRQAEEAYSAAWATENMQTIQRHKFEQYRWCGANNTWAPLANASHLAMAEIVEAAALMGFDTGNDRVAFVQGLETSLDMATQLVDAKVLDGGQKSWSKRGDSNTAEASSKSKPVLEGEQMTPKLESIRPAYDKVQTANAGLYTAMLKDRQTALEEQEGQATAEIAQINNVIGFWSGMTNFAMPAATVVAGTVTGEAGAGAENNGDRHAQKELGKAKAAAQKAEQDPSDYESDIDAHAHADNYEQHHDTWGKGGDAALKRAQDSGEYTPSDAQPAHVPNISPAGLVEGALTYLNSARIQELTKKVDTFDKEAEANKKTIRMVETKRAIDDFSGALLTLQTEMDKLGKDSMRDREQDMVKFGDELDAYGDEHKAELEKVHVGDLAPGANGEIYGTALACVAKIEKYRQLSSLALTAFAFNEFSRSIAHLGRERSGRERSFESASRSYREAFRAPPSLPPTSPEEQDVYQQISDSYLELLKLDTHWKISLEGVVAKFKTLMRKASGMNTRDAVGKQF